MKRLVYIGLCLTALAWLPAASAVAQPPGGVPAAAQPPSGALPGIDMTRQWHFERVSENHWKLTGDVEIEQGGTKISANEVEIFTDRDLLTAKGNVTLTTETQRISADALEFNLKTRLGTFHHASGSTKIQQDKKRPVEESQFGQQEPEMLFYGETIEKIGDRKYRITKGGFTTCVQPQPRWELTSGTVVLSMDHYAMLRNPIMRVKGVPVFYLPLIYYPINKEDRATGFLMPMYGSSTLRGQTLSNAFFWAINRSQDATLMYDWFSKTGQGLGSEYRYLLSPSSTGNARFYMLREKPTTYLDTSGKPVAAAGRRSFEAQGGLTQDLPFKLKARGRIDYFSNITVQQTYNTNIYSATQRQRYYGGSVSGNWGLYNLTGALDRTQYFFNDTNSTTSGSMPRLNFSRGEKPIGHTPVYVGVTAEYAGIVRQTNTGATVKETGLQRIDTTPTVRFPFSKFPFFTVNSSLGWRFTTWSESIDTVSKKQVPVGISRSYFDMQTRIVGPVFNRIWNKPNSGYAQKIKHTIEPWVNLQRVTAIDNSASIVKLDSVDYIVGGTTQVTYGLNNRIYAKPPGGGQGGAAAAAREIVNVGLQQTFYSVAAASTVDPRYSTSFGTVKPKRLSPLSIAAQVSPTAAITSSFRAEYNTYVSAFMTLGAVGSYLFRDNLTASAGWSQRRYVANLPGYNVLSSANHYLNADATFRIRQNRYGGSASFNYDIKNGFFLQRRFVGYYNAQCCGVVAEFQTYNFSGVVYTGGYRPLVPQDHRFSISITLAGVGSFSPFFGAMGGNQSYR